MKRIKTTGAHVQRGTLPGVGLCVYVAIAMYLSTAILELQATTRHDMSVSRASALQAVAKIKWRFS